MELNFNSVETIPVLNASAAFKTDSGKVFKEDMDIVPTFIDKSLSYIPWGGDNNMPFNILNLIESDETLATCQMFNAEVCYGSGLQYNTDSCNSNVPAVHGPPDRHPLQRLDGCLSRLPLYPAHHAGRASGCQRSNTQKEHQWKRD